MTTLVFWLTYFSMVVISTLFCFNHHMTNHENVLLALSATSSATVMAIITSKLTKIIELLQKSEIRSMIND